ELKNVITENITAPTGVNVPVGDAGSAEFRLSEQIKKPSSSRHNALFVTTFCSQERADLPHSRGMHHPFRLRGC
ncbi:hypothetical protein, partial [Escherichia coli]